MSKKTMGILLLFTVFTVFLLGKWNGHWDSSNRYGMEYMEASSFQDYTQAMLDRNPDTSWTNNFEFYGNDVVDLDYIEFHFVESEEIASVRMEGTLPDQLQYFYLDEEGNWVLAGVNVWEQSVKTTGVKIAVAANATELFWEVQEVYFNE